MSTKKLIKALGLIIVVALLAAAPTLQSMFSPLGKYRPFEVDEGSPAFPLGNP